MRGISFIVQPNEAFGLVGESGSGKSITLRSILGLLPPGARRSRLIRYGDDSLLDLSDREMQRMRGSRIGMVFQDPMTALNPVLRVGTAVAQVIQFPCSVRAPKRARRGHRDHGTGGYPRRGADGTTPIPISSVAACASASSSPWPWPRARRILLADEPTTALDVVVQAAILRLLDGLRREGHMSLLLVSHDLAIISGVCDRVAVMYAGEIVEQGPTAEVLRAARHPYTLRPHQQPARDVDVRAATFDPGQPARTRRRLGAGCAFAPRCSMAIDACRDAAHPAAPDRPRIAWPAASVPRRSRRSLGVAGSCLHRSRRPGEPFRDGGRVAEPILVADRSAPLIRGPTAVSLA